MNNDAQIFLTKLFFLAGTLGGAWLQIFQDIDLILGVILKFVSVISFIIVIVINLPKLNKTVRTYIKKLKK